MASGIITKEELRRLREEYPTGTRVMLIDMQELYCDMPEGLKGTVTHVDDTGSVHVNWDDGSMLAAVYGADRIRKL